MYVHHMHVQYYRGQKRGLHILELELQMVMSCQVGARTQTQVLYKYK